MASSTPSSVLHKIYRAKHHLDSYIAESHRYFDGRSSELMVDLDFTKDPPINRLSAELPLPAVLPLILGDCLQNLRSSLDYLVRELVLAAKREPTKTHAFPVCEDVGGFKDQIRRGRLSDLSRDVVTEIEALQPYFGGQDFVSFRQGCVERLESGFLFG